MGLTYIHTEDETAPMTCATEWCDMNRKMMALSAELHHYDPENKRNSIKGK